MTHSIILPMAGHIYSRWGTAIININPFRYTHYWLGLLSDDGTRWRWADGTPISWTNWQVAPPDLTASRCGAASSTDDRWVAAACSEKYVFLCEKSSSKCCSKPPTTPPIVSSMH